ncbi:hypothetical protein MUP95_10080, partial [bacterium]|nr:hypothetical protein [bacterium]
MRRSKNVIICRVVIFSTLFIHFFDHSKNTSVSAQPYQPYGTYIGTDRYDRIGYFLSDLGDVNHDGYDDFAIASYHEEYDDWGGVWLILGKAGGYQKDLSLNVVADAHFKGSYIGHHVGVAVGSKGDVNGDGYDDILIGGDDGEAENKPGHAYLIFGKSSANWGNNFILEDQADASFDGENVYGQAGFWVDIIGDLNGDGCDEFLVGAHLNGMAGTAYLFKGKSSGWQRHIPLANADATFVSSVEDSRVGSCVRQVGDVNHDGIPDFAIGAGGIGKVYLFFGRSSINWGQNFSLSNADVIFTEENTMIRTWTGVGLKIAPAGDVNGDGYDDFLIGDQGYGGNEGGDGRGRVYLIFGKATGSWVKDTDLSQSNVSYTGEVPLDEAGYSISGGFDHNNDGFSDFLIGAVYNDQNGYNAGKVYLINGKRSGWQSSINLSDVTAFFLGEGADSHFGFAVSGVGNVNSFGGDDFTISAAYYHWNWYGKVYLYLGRSTNQIVNGFVYYNTDVPVADVTILVNGEPVTQTDVSAYYSFSVSAGEDVTVTPSKPSGEDIGETTVTSYDAALVARSVVKLESLNASQIKVADVDKSGIITMYDAVQIARYAVGAGGGAYVGDWIFEPESLVFTDVQDNYEDQNFQAMVMGDVDGSWNPGLPKIIGADVVSPLWDKSFSINHDTLTLFFSVNDPVPLLSFDLALEYDKTALNFLAIKKGTTGETFQIFSSLDGEGLRAGGFCIEPVEHPGQLILIQFRMTKPVQDIGPVTLRRLQFNRDILGGTIVLWHGEESISSRPTFFLYRNYPNPFNSSTT